MTGAAQKGKRGNTYTAKSTLVDADKAMFFDSQDLNTKGFPKLKSVLVSVMKSVFGGTQNIGLPGSVPGTLYVDTNIVSTPAIHIPGKVIEIIANVDDAPLTDDIEINIKKNGSNAILNTVLSIAAGSTSGSSTDIDTDYDDFVKGNYGTLDISQVGVAGDEGVNLRFTIILEPV